jgi:WD40 repeat protein
MRIRRIRIFIFFISLLFVYFVISCKPLSKGQKLNESVLIKQITQAAHGHELCVFGLFSPDDQWIVYSCGPNHSNDRIEKVNINTGQVQQLYKIEKTNEYGPGCGTVSFCDTQEKIIFIHGPFNSSKDRQYEFWRRSGAVIDEYGQFFFLDARDVTEPFTEGALRGGTHCHEWSSDGSWVSFTYNDAIMAKIESKTGNNVNLRTVGVSRPNGIVEVDDHPENHDGRWFSALVVEVTPEPALHTDQISRACNNGWVGKRGYRKMDGSQQRAIAFMGKTVDAKGNPLMEVYIVDLPDEIKKPQHGKTLCGTKTEMPGVVKGASQKRLTYTEDRKFPGICLETRHWLRSSADGSKIGYLAKDDKGVVQAFYVSPIEKKPVQISNEKHDITSSVFWSPDGDFVSYICDNSIFVCSVETGVSVRLTPKYESMPKRAVWSHKGDKIVFARKALSVNGKMFSQIFIIEVPRKLLKSL